MESNDFVLLWQEHYEKIDATLQINRRLLQDSLQSKLRASLLGMIRLRIWGILIALLYLGLLGCIIWMSYKMTGSLLSYFALSMIAIFLFNVKALADYIRHAAWIRAIQYDASVREIQQKLSRLYAALFRHNRVMVLQLPFWTTFYLSARWFPHAVCWGYIIFQFLFTLLFMLAAYWLYKHINPANAHKKWVRLFINGTGGKKLARAMQYAEELRELAVSEERKPDRKVVNNEK
ncbi:MAG TPA: hypothetical protein VG842_07965 [Sediminibacterium sp.]|nr:hypothetical protein [Sediminibacterium sp.]